MLQKMFLLFDSHSFDSVMIGYVMANGMGIFGP